MKILLDENFPLALHRSFGVSTTPTIVLVGRDGVIRLYHPGAMPWDDLEPLVRRPVG